MRRRTALTADTEHLVEMGRRAYTLRPVVTATPAADPLAPFSPAVRAWFEATFEAPTQAQAEGWAAISERPPHAHPRPDRQRQDPRRVPLDARPARRARRPARRRREQPGSVRVLYVSPLKALTYDVERNLRAPLAGIALAAARLGEPAPDITRRQPDRRHARRGPPEPRPPPAGHPDHDPRVALPDAHEPGPRRPPRRRARDRRRGPRDRRLEARRPPRPEPRAPRAASSRRSARATPPAAADRPERDPAAARDDRPVPRRRRAGPRGDDRRRRRPQAARAPGRRPDRGHDRSPARSCRSTSSRAARRRTRRRGPASGRRSTPRILELIREHRSTIVFTNSRRLAERLAQRLNELAGEELVRAHHGSDRPRAAGRDRGGAQGRPRSRRSSRRAASSSASTWAPSTSSSRSRARRRVARGLQRVGRAGHQVGAPSKGVIFPKYRGDLLEAAVVAERMHEGAIEATTLPAQPARRPRPADRRDDGHGPLDGRRAPRDGHPGHAVRDAQPRGPRGRPRACSPAPTRRDEFAELKPRVTWDRVDRRHRGPPRRPRRRGHERRHDPGPRAVRRVHGRRGGDARPARRRARRGDGLREPGRRGDHARGEQLADRGDRPRPGHGVAGAGRAGQAAVLARRRGRPADRARAGARGVRPRGRGRPRPGRRAAGRRPSTASKADHDLDELAAENLVAYLEDEREVVGALPTDRRIVVERFRDELGDWRLVLLTPFGGRVHAPWSLALEARIGERLGGGGPDDLVRRRDRDPAARRRDRRSRASSRCCSRIPTRSRTSSSARSRRRALFASRFRENAARALLLPRRRPGTRTPLWQQRQRAADLLAVASRYGSFPILVETYREVLSDVFDLPALREVLGGIASREIAVHSVETLRASPFASSLLFDYVAAYMYDGDAPLAERRAGRADARPRPAPRAARPGGAARAARPRGARRPRAEPPGADRRPPGDDRRPAPRPAPAARRPVGRRDRRPDARAARRPATPGSTELVASRRAVPARIAGEERWIAIEDVARYRDGVGVSPPTGVPDAFLGPADGGARRAARPLRPDPRPVPDAGPGPALGPAGRRRRGRAGAAARGRDDPPRRVPAGRRGARVDRSGRPAAPPPPVAGPAPARGRAGRSGGARPVPAGLARRRRRSARRAAPLRPIAALERLAEVVDQLAGLRDPGLGPRAGRPAGPDPGLPAAAPRRARGDGRGRLGRAGEPRPRRRPDRARTGPGREVAPAGRPRRRRRAPRRSPPRGDSRAPRAGGAPRSTGSCSPPPAAARTARSSTRCGTSSGPARSRTTRSPRSGRCAGSGPARDARRRPGRLTSLGPPEAAGRWSLVEPEDRPVAPTPTERLHALRLALLDRHGVVTREAVADRGGRGRVLRGLPDPPGARGGRPDPARLLRRRARGRPVRAGRRDRAAARASASRPRSPRGARRPSPRRRRSRQPVRRRDPVAAPRRGRSAAAPAGGRRLRRARRRRRRRSTSSAAAGRSRRCPAADDPEVAEAAAPRARRARRRPPRPRARHHEGRRRARSASRRSASGSSPRASAAGYRGLVARARRAAEAATPCPRATRSSGPRPASGRTSSAAP